MTSTPMPILVGQVLGITTSAGLSGAILFISWGSVPALRAAPPSIAARQWAITYDIGKRTSPLIAATSSLLLGYVAYATYDLRASIIGQKAGLYALAAFSTICIAPFTILVMEGTNNQLQTKASEAKKVNKGDETSDIELVGGESVGELLGRWSVLNAFRGILPLIGSILALWASLD
ncbi:hypothetical protein MMC20_002357 [Loxospora ochrophaea]|nr:hypothetical protein [Loxospora ochrophaea]